MKSHFVRNSLRAAYLLLAATAISGPALADDAFEASYKMNPGDILSVGVWEEENLQRGVLILPDGTFSFPLAGDIVAAGRSVAEVREELISRLNQYIPDPVVTITVEQVQGNKAYVIGQVQRPGEYIAGSRLDVVQALAMAGGFTPFAQVNDVRVLRRENGVLRAINFRFGDIEKGKSLEQNVLLKPGDVVVVP